MTFISYAQNREDVMLWRALKEVELGFYVDVGANHPVDDSVTKAFYDRGWSGVNIEPLAEHFAQLQAERPRDINLKAAAGATDGEIDLFNTGVRGLATVSSSVAEMHRAAGLATSSSRVPLRRLAGVFEEYAKGDVHFLKIDVEGFERDVLEGMDFSRFRPWIVVVEATTPNSQRTETGWEPLLLDAAYRYVYFDGLNRYYTAVERDALAVSFSSPPNVFDNFVSAERVRLRQVLDATILRAEQAEIRLWQSEQRVSNAEAYSRSLQLELDTLYGSTSWRVTRPLRQLMTRLRQQPAIVPDVPTDLSPPAGTEAVADEATSIAVPAAASLFPARTGRSERFNPAAFPLCPLSPETMLLTQPSLGSQEYWFRFLGHVESHYSLAIINRGLAIALDDLTHERLAFVPYHLVPYANPANLPASQKVRLETMFGREIPDLSSDRTVSLVHHYPLIVDPEKSRFRCVVFFWEETAVPDSTVRHINDNFDAVLVASSFVKRVLRNSGCPLPIFVIPVGIDHLIGPEVPPIGALKPSDDRVFRFLHVSSAFERKGVDVLLRVFFDTFSATDPVELFIKTFPNPHNRVREQLAELTAVRSDAPKVVIDESHMDDAGMLALYRSAQAMVLPTRGEGFNLPAAEAMALGLPVIVTAFGAHVDFCARRTALPIPFHFSRSRSHLKSSEACWVEPDVVALGDQMRVLYGEIMSGSVDLSLRRQAALDHVRQTYTWQNSAQAVMASVAWLDSREGAAQRHIVGRRLTLLGPWMTRCGVAEYNQNLLSAFGDSWSLRVYCDSRTMPNPVQSIYQPAWVAGDVASVCGVLDEIVRDRPDVLLVEHQPSLFRLADDVCDRLAALSRMGCVVILELHSTLQLLHEYRESLVSVRAIAALRTLDRIIVHNPEDFDCLLALGIVSNVLLLPLGVVQPRGTSLPAARRSDWGIGDDDLVLGCFGFILPHKGIDTLVETVAPLAEATQRKVHLIGLNATMDAQSEGTVASYQERARALGVDSQISWITDYRPIDECVQLLEMADYVVFPYKQTRESASAAVTIGLATLKPVLVSPLPIFSDLSECTWRMSGESVEDIVRAVCDLESSPEDIEQLRAGQQEWLAERSWARISPRLEAVIDGLLVDRAFGAATGGGQERALTERVDAAVGNAQLLVDVSSLFFDTAETDVRRVALRILEELLAAPPKGFGVCPVYGVPGQGYRYTSKYSPCLDSDGADRSEQPVKVSSGDVFLGLDQWAHLCPIAEAELRGFRLAGARIHFVIYDVIPLRYPHYASSEVCNAAVNWMRVVAREADSLLCVSSSVVVETRIWLKEHTEDSPLLKVKCFSLGSDVANLGGAAVASEEETSLLARIGNAPSFLMVGTLVPRKGQSEALEAFDDLWRQGLAVNLVLIGTAGLSAGDLSTRIRTHPEFGQRLFWLEEARDELLDRLFAAGSCLLAASGAEGFCLPMFKAAQHHLSVVARDIPVFREIAREHAYYFSDVHPEALAATIRTWLSLESAGLVPRSSSIGRVTWQRSLHQLLNCILEDRDWLVDNNDLSEE